MSNSIKFDLYLHKKMYQGKLFEVEKEYKWINIKEAARVAQVSVATIRNWIKTGYLIAHKNKYIDKDSLQNFLENIAGKEKLVARANKLLKDNIDINLIEEKVQKIINQNDFIDISFEYEKSLPESYKNKYGVFYTPIEIVRDMMKDIPINENTTFLDPCCGTGNFIMHALEKGIKPENIYGYDIDKNAIIILKERVKRIFNVDLPNVKNENFLNAINYLQKNKKKFDCIFTNPPWGAKISKEDKEHYSQKFQTGKSTDTSSVFLAASLLVLSDNGYLGFLVQEAFFNIAVYEDIRCKILKKKLLRLVDYDRAFSKLQTKAQAVILQNRKSNEYDLVICENKNKKFVRFAHSFLKNPKYIFNFYTDNEDAKIIDHLFSIPHITLKDRCKWGMGIVTGNNKKFCKSTPSKNYIPIFKGSDIHKNKIKEPTLFISLKDFDIFQQTAPKELYESKEKIIYRFITPKLCFFYDNQQRYILNSANFFIPFDIPISMIQLVDLLNSDIINWLFQKLFNTHKILRSDLESLPIHTSYFYQYSIFSEKNYLNFLTIEKSSDGTYRIKK